MSYNSILQDNNKELEAILAAINSLPDAGGGNVLENCSVELDIQVADAMAFYMYADPSGSLMTGSTYLNYSNQTVEVLNGGMIALYAPGNTSDKTEGLVNMWGSSGDYAVLAYRVTGDGYIWVQ